MLFLLLLTLLWGQPITPAEPRVPVEVAQGAQGKAHTEALGVLRIVEKIGGIEDIVKKITDFAKDETIKGVLLIIDSDGGRCGSSEIIFQEIRLLSQKKPVVALIINSCHSGAYWIACAADWIIAPAAASVGNIGIKYVVEKHRNRKVTEENYTADFDITVIHTGKFKVCSDPNTPEMNKEELEWVQNYTNTLYETFTSYVAQARNLSLEMVSIWAEGKWFTGAQALKIGLIDQIGSYSDAIKKLEALIAERGFVITQKLPLVE